MNEYVSMTREEFDELIEAAGNGSLKDEWGGVDMSNLTPEQQRRERQIRVLYALSCDEEEAIRISRLDWTKMTVLDDGEQWTLRLTPTEAGRERMREMALDAISTLFGSRR